MKNHTIRAISLSLVLALALAACGGGSGGDTTTPDDGTTAESPTTAAGGSGADISIAGFAFSGPSSVPLGTTVTVTNNDTVSHTWTSDDQVFDSGSLATGDTFEFTFEEAGEYAYFCNFHSEMTGTITVEG